MFNTMARLITEKAGFPARPAMANELERKWRRKMLVISREKLSDSAIGRGFDLFVIFDDLEEKLFSKFSEAYREHIPIAYQDNWYDVIAQDVMESFGISVGFGLRRRQ